MLDLGTGSQFSGPVSDPPEAQGPEYQGLYKNLTREREIVQKSGSGLRVGKRCFCTGIGSLRLGTLSLLYIAASVTSIVISFRGRMSDCQDGGLWVVVPVDGVLVAVALGEALVYELVGLLRHVAEDFLWVYVPVLQRRLAGKGNPQGDFVRRNKQHRGWNGSQSAAYLTLVWRQG